MYKTIFLLVKATIQTQHTQVYDAVAEIREKSTCQISNTKKVKIHDIQLTDYKLKKS